MTKNKWFGPAVLALILGVGAVSGCLSTGNGAGIALIEDMSDADFAKWKLYISLGTKIGANRLLAEGAASMEDLNLAASALESLRDATLVPGAQSLIGPALEEAGLTNDEVHLLLLIVEQELLSRGALGFIDPETGTLALSPRTKELLTEVAKSLRSAASVTEEETSAFVRSTNDNGLFQ